VNVLLIASLTLREASRRRLILTGAVATLVLVVLTAFGFHALATMHTERGKRIEPHDLLVAANAIETMMAFMFSFVLALGAAFLGALSVGSEIENGTLLAILPRPIRRWEVLAGKWIGNATLLAGYALAVGASEFFVVRATTGYLPPAPLETLCLLIVESWILLTLTIALSVRLSAVAAGFTAIVLFGVAWMSGIVGSFAQFFHNGVLQNAATVVSLAIPTDGLWRAASFSMQPAIVRAMTPGNALNPFVPAAPVPFAYYLWCACWLVAVMCAGIWSFQLRDI
jgi:ABC-type transport system involved in multi-copper enzyme maturation permease subunit